ncbi:class I adenylate-forming enzyme family protein [Aestuariivita sp.]|jgi:acyl-CoA synthetase (AMP-forming)/AMP-acid ligase II|uniref:class I adenylate-forming enzyme family protein n=1 Tax=Aestuariivita sp. TaxID=1872407 RepID=UPI002171B9F0|nr:class I adenylate-forming enzyme family protein [Aestuariivita sp.]MCE8006109.1 acyl--CoA ligase [Aestuariivita sp.]
MTATGAEALNLAAALEVNAGARPDHPAIVSGDRMWTHAEVAAEVRALASWLCAQGVTKDDVIGVALRDTPDHLMMIFAVVRLGAVLLPLDWRWTEAERTRVATHFGARMTICEPDAEPGAATPALTMTQLRSAPVGADDPPFVLDPDLPLLMSLSSGTTGMPSGPELTHPQMLRRFWTHWINLGLNADHRYMSATPLYFGGGRTFAMSILYAGGTVILFPPPFRPGELCAEIARRGATSLFLVPTQLRGLLELGADELGPVRALDVLISSGAPLDPQERSEIGTRLNTNFREYYASTEGGGISLSTPQTRARCADSVGRPVFGVEIAVVDDTDVPVPAGTVGRLRYRGPGVATRSFSKDGHHTDLLRDGWFYPGDLAEMDAAGFVTLRGRAKEMIIRGGVNVYPFEIETVIRSHPQVADVAVMGVADARLGETVVAACIAKDASLDSGALLDWCATQLAPYKVPAQLRMVSSFPRNSAGKVLKAELLDLFQTLDTDLSQISS